MKYLPIPGMPKMVSTTTDPVRSAAAAGPTSPLAMLGGLLGGKKG